MDAIEPEYDPLFVTSDRSDVLKEFRRLRGSLNTKLQKINDMDEFRKMASMFQEDFGKDFWDEKTRHNETETFKSLAMEHQERIKMLGPIGREEWIKNLEKVTTISEFEKFQSAYMTLEKLQHFECEEALMKKGRELGIGNDEDSPWQ